MRKRALLSIPAFILSGFLHAQCPVTPVLLTTQAQVDNFPVLYPTCNYIDVRFEVRGAGITDLTPLSLITGFSKNLFVNFCPDLPSLAGLDNVTEVLGDLTIEANHALTDLVGFGSLVEAPALVKVQNNDGLLTLDGLTPGGVLTHVGSLVIIENNSLEDLSDLYDALETVGEYVYIQDNPALTSINTFGNLVSAGQYLTIDNHPSLSEITGFGNLQTVGLLGAGWDFEVIDCPLLTTLNSFTSLSEVGKDFEISGNNNLTTMEFPGLTSIEGALSIGVNASLTSLVGLGDFTLAGPLFILSNSSLPECEAEGICNYLDGPGTATIANNDPGCNSIAQVEAACLLLPVELTRFDAKEADGAVVLNWQTASEKNNDFFRIEHSTDGIEFRPLGFVKGNGTTATTNSYSYRHEKPLAGDNYYRLQQVDFDGTAAYSGIVRVRTSARIDVEIYPNPTTGYARLRGDLPEGWARLTDSKGRLISEKHLPEQYVFDLTREPEGVYLLEITTAGERIVKRIVRQ